jgi:hypothetical protein
MLVLLLSISVAKKEKVHNITILFFIVLHIAYTSINGGIVVLRHRQHVVHLCAITGRLLHITV